MINYIDTYINNNNNKIIEIILLYFNKNNFYLDSVVSFSLILYFYLLNN